MERSFWGWGDAGAALGDAAVEGLGQVLAARHPGWVPTLVPAPAAGELRLREPRVAAPAALEHLTSDDAADRAGHSYGKAFRDVVRALRRSWPAPPDLVVRPGTVAEVAAVLDWCADAAIACVPYGGGSSVVGGVETDCGPDGVVSLDLTRLDRILEVDEASRAAHVEGGVLGPALEDGLRPLGLTLRHFPQSFEFSTLGGWIATRSGGHFATGPTHIDDFVESVTMQTPAGEISTRRLPASGAGPSPDRLMLGSEGTLGVITSAWMRVLERPVHRASATVVFDDFTAGANACRGVVQAGLRPANCRLLDRDEALLAGAGDGDRAVLLLAFESAYEPVDAALGAAVTVARDHGGTAIPRSGTRRGGDAADSWRSSFLRMPYLRDAIARLGALTETFESAVTWDRFDDFVDSVRSATQDALDTTCGGGTISCRLTHVYPDGAAPYFTVVAPSALADQLEHWDVVKAAASEAILAGGGTITHHHAVGRVHRPWFLEQVPDLYSDALAAVKSRLDPSGVMNPGVLLR